MNLLRIALLSVTLVFLPTVWAAPPEPGLYLVLKVDTQSLDVLDRGDYRVRLVSDRYVIVAGDDSLEELLGKDGMEPADVSIPGDGDYFVYSGPAVQVEGTENRVLPDGAILLRGERRELDPENELGEYMTELPEEASLRALRTSAEPPFLSDARVRAESTRQVVDGILDAVSVDSLMNFVTVLSEDTLGMPRSRYAICTPILTEALPYIVANLENYLVDDGGEVTTDELVRPYWTYTPDAFNIEGLLPGTGEIEGCFILCAHYDAISQYRTCAPPHSAPGADDNATGVACMLEAARVLSDQSFPFDLRFIAFSGEELGLHGSQQYAENAAEDSMHIIGVLNFDMVAYTPPSYEDSVVIYTSPASKWLADWMEDSAETYSLNANINIIENMIAASDHFHFWQQGYDAIFATEAANPRNNPFYHTVGDRVANIRPSHLLKAAEVLIASVARFVEVSDTTDFVLNEGDISYHGTQGQPDDELYLGDTLGIEVRVRNLGKESGGSLDVSIWDGHPDDGGKKLDSVELSAIQISVVPAIAEFTWVLNDIEPGVHYLAAKAELAYGSGPEENTSNNSAYVPIVVRSQNLMIVDDFVWPNPVMGDIGSGTLRYELSTEASVKVELLDQNGQVLAEWKRSHTSTGTPEENLGVTAGENDLPLGELDESLSNLASGVYLYRIAAFSGSSNDPDDVVVGKFALIR